MKYEIYGPFSLPKDDRGYIHLDKSDQHDFWAELSEKHPGLSGACGCYVFAVRASKGGKPWYVGKAEKRSFEQECFTADKLVKYNSAMKAVRKGTPILFLYARITSGKRRIARPSKNGSRDIDFLEKMLIGFALDKNADLVNVRDTKLLRGMSVPGLINKSPGKLPTSAAEAKRFLGY